MGDLRRRILVRNSGKKSYPPGVYAYCSGGILKTYNEVSDYDSSAIGIAILTPQCQFIMHKSQVASEQAYGGYNKNLSSAATTSSNSDTAKTDFRGEENSNNIISACAGYTDSTWSVTGAPAFEYAKAYYDGKGYVGSLGEWWAAYSLKDEVERMMLKLSRNTPGIYDEEENNMYYITSTQYNSKTLYWGICWKNGHLGSLTRRSFYNGNFFTCPFMHIDIPIVGCVDLGLPSGTLWCTGNICKDANGNYYLGEPTEYGCYFSWGNITGYNEGEGYNFNSTNYNSSTGKNLTADIPNTDTVHDAALARLGYSYCLPTKAHFDELIANCTYIWSTDYHNSGVVGVVFKSNIAGYTDKEIFIPASGRYQNSDFSLKNVNCILWSSSYASSSNAYRMICSSTDKSTGTLTRARGLAIRPIIRK